MIARSGFSLLSTVPSVILFFLSPHVKDGSLTAELMFQCKSDRFYVQPSSRPFHDWKELIENERQMFYIYAELGQARGTCHK